MSAQLLHLLHLASPALPIGSFHFSQGLELAVERGWVCDEASALEWIAGLARNAVGTLDLPILQRLYRARARHDEDTERHWASLLIAARETEELRAEDRHMGNALARVLREVGSGDVLSGWPLPLTSYAHVFARACVAWSVGERDALLTYAWAWCENQTLAAVKLVPLGQSAGQRILSTMIPILEEVAQAASILPDEAIGTGALMQGFASAQHESQYTRLFRS